jgi:hypothetical protein
MLGTVNRGGLATRRNIMSAHHPKATSVSIAGSCCVLALVAFGRGPNDVYRSLPISSSADPAVDYRAPNNIINIPRNPGPDADATVIAFAASIEQIDNNIAVSKKQGIISDHDLHALLDARNATMAELLRGKRILTETSGGAFPATSQQTISADVAAILGALKTHPPNDNVVTKIEYPSPPGTATFLVYQTYAESVAKSDSWSTYTPHQRLAVATYIFQVRVDQSSKTCTEAVPVLSDPTERFVCGWFRP